MIENKRIKRLMIIWNFTCYILLVCGSVYFHALYKKRIAVFLALVFAGFYVGLMLLLRLDERYLKCLKQVLIGGCLFASASISVLFVELISGNIFVDIEYFIGNCLIYSIIYFILFFTIRRLTVSVMIGIWCHQIFTVANYYVIQFRGNPIVPSDFFTIKAAASVMNTYHYEITWEMYFSLGMMLWWLIIVKAIAYVVGKVEKREVLRWTLPVTLIVAAVVGTDFFKPSLDLWDIKNSINEYGVGICLVSNLRGMYIKEPEGYLYENLELWSDEYRHEKDSNQQNMPNIIVVMNESF